MSISAGAFLQGLAAISALLALVGWCGDMRGFLKYGGSYWPRKRQAERWRAERKLK
ncbi:hypothetical protein [Paracoccus sp. IB05]|uniref:hypothetical protein n=1 Tax=Paracoccus sp. IB05 TaxID=2779367 RepID=UPI0018E79242|nr:hypothetical protein [Paracoccus sp. IB05]MBJ2152961.1 hypothetical protein [Paracoccus sp. IB05]